MEKAYKYDIAISFGETDRNAALALSLALEMEGFSKVYYYPDSPEAMWGQHLESTLEKLYTEEARYVVVLLSKKYFRRKFTQVELNAVLRRMEKESHVCMLPVLLDPLAITLCPQLMASGYLQWKYNPKEIAAVLRKLLGSDRTQMNMNSPEDLGDTILFKNNYVNSRDIHLGNKGKHPGTTTDMRVENNKFNADTFHIGSKR